MPIKNTNLRNADNKALLIKLSIFVLYPFGAFFFSLRNIASRSSYIIFVLFGMLFAWRLNPTGLGDYVDLLGVMEKVKSLNISTNQLIEQVIAFISFSDNAPKELYDNVFIWISKLVTDNPHFFFLLVSIPWLYFFLNSLKLITDDKKFTNSLYCIFILILFVIPRDIITIQNPRFTTGCWMVVYATLKYFLSQNNKKYLILILFAPLIHAGFWPYTFIFILGLFVLKYTKINFMLLYISVPFSYLSYDLFSVIDYSILPLPTSILNWISSYLSDDSFATYVSKEGASGFFWVQKLFDFFMKTMYLLIPYFLMKVARENPLPSNLDNLYKFYFYFYAVVNFIQFLPVIGERYYWIIRIISIFIWFKIVYPKYNNILMLILFSCSYSIFRRYIYTDNVLFSCVYPELFYTPFPYLFYEYI